MVTHAIKALELPDVEPAKITSAEPRFIWVDPRQLFVNEKYQRSLSRRSLALITKIVANWDWRAFKPPVVIEVDNKMEVVDGQHTAIGAISHGGISKIPVMIIKADELKDQASSFVRHNKDRIAVTPLQLHKAMVAAGDEDALTIEQVCERAGVRLLKTSAPVYKAGDTLSVGAIHKLIKRRFPVGARKVLEICAKSGVAPISVSLIRGVEYLVFAEEYKNELTADRITAIISALGDGLENEADRYASERKLPVWRGVASIIYLYRRKKT